MTTPISSSHTDHRMAKKVVCFVLIDPDLYNRGYSLPLLKCLSLEQTKYVKREIHHGVCRLHSGHQTMTAQVLRACYYWPTSKTDCADFVKRCKD